MKSLRARRSRSDRVAWAIFATGIVAMLAAAYVITGLDHIATIYERRGLFQVMFFVASAFALSGPLAASIGQGFAGPATRPSGKKEATGLEEL